VRGHLGAYDVLDGHDSPLRSVLGTDD